MRLEPSSHSDCLSLDPTPDVIPTTRAMTVRAHAGDPTLPDGQHGEMVAAKANAADESASAAVISLHRHSLARRVLDLSAPLSSSVSFSFVSRCCHTLPVALC